MLTKQLQVNSALHQTLRKYKDGVFVPIAKSLHQFGVTPNMVTYAGAAIGLLSLPLLWVNYWWFAIGCVLSLVCDGIDGTLARYTHRSNAQGAKFDYTVDITLMLLIYASLTLWLGKPLFVFGLNSYVIVQLLNWLAGNLVRIAPARFALVTCIALNVPILGLWLVTAYSVLMLVALVRAWLTR